MKLAKEFLKLYLPKHKINISIKRKKLNDNYGELYIDDYNYKPRSFVIYIDKEINNELYTKTLLHELWHIYQFVTGTVKIKHNKTYHNNIDVTDEPEENLEFEKEAEQMEEELKKIFFAHSARAALYYKHS